MSHEDKSIAALYYYYSSRRNFRPLRWYAHTVLYRLHTYTLDRHYTKRPRINAQKTENINMTFKFLKNEGVRVVNIDSSDIMQGNMKLTLGTYII